MHLVALFQAAQDADGILDRRLIDHYRLEAPLQRGILLDMLAIFIQRGCANAMQFSTRQHRLQHIGCVHGAFRGPGSHQRMQFVDKEDNAAFSACYFFQNGFQALLELAAELGAGNESAQVKRDHLLISQRLWHIATYNALRQAFNDGGFTDARLTDQHRVILGTPA